MVQTQQSLPEPFQGPFQTPSSSRTVSRAPLSQPEQDEYAAQSPGAVSFRWGRQGQGQRREALRQEASAGGGDHGLSAGREH